MNDKPALTEQNFRLAAAYHRMPVDGRKALDRLVGQLAEVDRGLKRVAPLPDADRNAEMHEAAGGFNDE